MSFLAPLLLGGIALAAIPIIIHRIRRPEREVVRFSSLMFVPDVPKEVIERRKIQHFLLMLLRILLLILLALAFSRPFWSSQEQAILADKGESAHLILLDTSMSMTMGGRFDQAKEMVRDILKELPSDARVALVSFDRQAVVRQDFTKPGDRALTRALGEVEPGLGMGDYWSGLKYAENLLLNQQADDANREAVLHLVSDYQIQSETENDWRLSGRITFQGHRTQSDPVRNFSISDVEVRRLDGGHQIATKVKYWQGSEPQQVEVSLHFHNPGMANIEPTSLVLVPGGASLAVFDVSLPPDQTVTGYVAIENDEFPEDNRRYFHWEPDPKQPVLLVTDEDPEQARTSSWFLSQAMGTGPQNPWQLQRQTAEAWAESNGAETVDQPMIFAGVDAWSPSRDAKLADHLARGGNALILMDDGSGAQGILQGLEPSIGIRLSQSPIEDNAIETWQWLAFDHPIFAPFGAARFNDFSQIRLNRRVGLELFGEQAAPLVKTEHETVIAEASAGPGKVIVWAFPPHLGWSNLAKNVKFVPVLEETLLYLSAGKQRRTEFETGSSLAPVVTQLGGQNTGLQMPDGSVLDLEDNGGQGQWLDQPGILSRAATNGEDWLPWAVVNVPFPEGNPEQWGLAEFALRLATNPRQIANASAEQEPQAASLGVRLEFGHAFLWVIGLLLAMETWLAFRLSRTTSSKSKGDS